MRTPRTDWTFWLPVLLVGFLAGPALAVDGVIEINQVKAKAGGVTPSDAPLFPVTIDHSGSYRLTSDLDVTDATARPGGVSAADALAINVTADYVTIDLNGFSIIGPAACTGIPPMVSCTPTGGGSGINDGTANGATHTTVLNGTVRGMGFAGINLLLGKDVRIERVHVAGNGSLGIAAGDGSTVTGCTSSHNMGGGILVGNACSVTDNLAYANNVSGITANLSCLVAGNTSTSNGVRGLDLGARTGYLNNALSFNSGGAVSGGVNLGQNMCDAALCP
jgi:hypothetical protein